MIDQSTALAIIDGESEPMELSVLEKPAVRESGINIGGDTVTQATAHLADEQKLLVRWLYTHARKNNWGWKEFELNTKLSSTTAYRIWQDKYRYPEFEHKEIREGGKVVRRDKLPHPKARERIPLDNICETIAKLKRLAEKRDEIFSAGFVRNSVYDRIEWICDKAFIRQKFAFIYGESQIGKSICLEEYTRLHNSGQTTYVEMPPAAGVQLMTRCIAAALNVNTRTCYEKLIEDVVNALDSSKLLILDEIHRVFTNYQKTSVMRCMDTIRYIQAKTKCGVVLCGTNTFRDNLKEGEFFQYLKQLKRRGLYELQLPTNPPREDLDLMSERFGLPVASGEAEDILLHIAKMDGFGVVIARLTDAAELASNKREKLNWGHFVKAHNIVLKMAQEGGR